MLAHACMRARAPPLAAAAGRARALGLGLGSGSLTGLVLFESGMGCEHTRTRPAPLQIQTARLQRLSEKPSKRLGGWTVVQLRAVGPNSCNGSVRIAATVENQWTETPLPERYK